MKRIITLILCLFCFCNLFALGETENKVSRDAWKQSKVNISFLNSPVVESVNIYLNNDVIGKLQSGENINVNCPEGNNTIQIESPNDKEIISFNSELNITYIQFIVSPLPMSSKATIMFAKGKRNSTVNLLLNGILNSTIEPGQDKELSLNEGKNNIEIKSGRKYSEIIAISANSNNSVLQFETSSILGKIKNVKLIDTQQLTNYKVQNLEITKTEIVQMPEEVRKQIEEEEIQKAEWNKMLSQFSKYHGEDEFNSNFNNLSNPYYYEKSDGYYFEHVVPVSWPDEKTYRAYCIKVSLFGGDQRSSRFYIDIGDYKPSDISKNNIMGTDFGQVLILQPLGAQDGLPKFKLIYIVTKSGVFL